MLRLLVASPRMPHPAPIACQVSRKPGKPSLRQQRGWESRRLAPLPTATSHHHSPKRQFTQLQQPYPSGPIARALFIYLPERSHEDIFSLGAIFVQLRHPYRSGDEVRAETVTRAAHPPRQLDNTSLSVNRRPKPSWLTPNLCNLFRVTDHSNCRPPPCRRLRLRPSHGSRAFAPCLAMNISQRCLRILLRMTST